MGTSDVACTEDDLFIFYQGRQLSSYDSSVLSAATYDDMDPDSIKVYRQARAKDSPDAVELSWTDEHLLYFIGCLDGSEATSKATVAGMLLFGKQGSIRRLFPMFRVDYVRVPGREWVQDVDAKSESIDMRGSILSLIGRVQTTILDDLPSGFSLSEHAVQREDKKLIPTRVIREAVVNTLMHRSYRVNQPIQVIRYANRIEIRNPGYSLKPDDRLGEPGSQPRNPVIAAALHETRFAETKGSGVRVMRQMMEMAGLKPPFFESDRHADTFTATFLFHHFLSEEDLRWLTSFRDCDLSNEEATALIFLRETGAINSPSYRAITGVDTLKASAHLRRLRESKLIEMRGKTSATYYVPGPRMEGAVGDAERSPDTSAHPITLVQVGGSETAGGDPQADVEPGQDGVFDSELPEHLKSLISALGTWAPAERIRSAIVSLCEWQPHSVAQLSERLGRNQAYISENYLSNLVEEGTLEYLYPETPKHPRQKYRKK